MESKRGPSGTVPPSGPASVPASVVVLAVEPQKGDRDLSTQDWRREGVGRDHHVNIHACIDVAGEAGRQTRGNIANLELSRERHVTAGGDRVMIIDCSHGPSRGLRRNGRKAAEESGDPKADAALIGTRHLGGKR